MLNKGYAVIYKYAMEVIANVLPQNEEIKNALRQDTKIFPEIAIRELLANLLIHQDFTITGTGPIVEIFEHRIEFINPGKPLLDTLRFIDETPRSRNEDLASLMRRMRICEERGSGIDKVISAVEIFQLPAPQFSETSNHTQATLYAYKKLAKMSKSERVRACYQHSCLKYVTHEEMTNTSLRQRFDIKDKNAAQATRIINDTLSENLIKPSNPENKSRRHKSYLPFWA